MNSHRTAKVDADMQISCPTGFYPHYAPELRKLVEQYLGAAEKLLPKPPFSLIVPHAGYFYSGQTAAWGFRQIQDAPFDNLIVLAPSHYDRFPYASLLSTGVYRTPLGDMPINRELAERLTESDKINFKISPRGHLNLDGTAVEHSISVQIPFLQVVQPQACIVPLLIGTHDVEAIRRIGETVSEIALTSNSLIVASSDLSHFYPCEYARQLDGRTLQTIETGDAITFIDCIESGDIEACGSAAVAAVLFANKRAGAVNACILHRSDSSDASPELKSRVVGYASAAFWI
ncbi:MAG: AmmeMemoRadiSam system protein B [Calditrichaeota bacterium]|nr:AmmeMemoRadiSam system protein B [Calditrichota bacterium]